jgi:GTP-binding protein
MIERYLKTATNLKAVFLLLDIRHAPNANDKQMYDWVLDNGYTPIVIATKMDKIKRSQVQKQLKLLRDTLGMEKGAKLFPYSSVTKAGREEIWEFIEKECLNV